MNNVARKVVFGDPEKIEKIRQCSLASQKINTSFVERNNGTIRNIDARCNRKTYHFSKCEKIIKINYCWTTTYLLRGNILLIVSILLKLFQNLNLF